MSLLANLRSRIAYRFRQATFRPYVVRRQFAGEDLQIQLGDLFGEAAYGPKHTHWPEFEWIKQHCIRPGDVVVDCGANHGFSTVLFSRWAGPRGRVHAFEPFGHNMEILKTNLALNNVTNVTCHQAAVGAAPGRVSISAHPNAMIVSDTHRPRQTEDVPLVTLDDTLAGERIGFMKIDVEGYELAVLQGARRILATAPRLDLELHVAYYRDRERELRDVMALVPLERYTIHVQTQVDGPIIPFDRNAHTLEVLARSDVVHLFCC